jgi:hypothetical protein
MQYAKGPRHTPAKQLKQAQTEVELVTAPRSSQAARHLHSPFLQILHAAPTKRKTAIVSSFAVTFTFSFACFRWLQCSIECHVPVFVTHKDVATCSSDDDAAAPLPGVLAEGLTSPECASIAAKRSSRSSVVVAPPEGARAEVDDEEGAKAEVEEGAEAEYEEGAEAEYEKADVTNCLACPQTQIRP